MILSVDPGDKHTGVALWRKPELLELSSTMDSLAEFVPWFKDCLVADALELVIFEVWALYPWAASEQSFSEMETSQLIGRIKQLCEDAGVPWVGQPASIKKPTAAVAAHRKVALVGQTIHARDAELHGYYWFWRGSERGSR